MGSYQAHENQMNETSFDKRLQKLVLDTAVSTVFRSMEGADFNTTGPVRKHHHRVDFCAVNCFAGAGLTLSKDS